jgi:hypothetical protein
MMILMVLIWLLTLAGDCVEVCPLFGISSVNSADTSGIVEAERRAIELWK